MAWHRAGSSLLHQPPICRFYNRLCAWADPNDFNHEQCQRTFDCGKSGNDLFSLQWRHNERDGVSNHHPHDCLLNRLFRRRWKKTSKPRVTGLCAGNSPVTGEFPTQSASDAENVSIWWRHHVGVYRWIRDLANSGLCESVPGGKRDTILQPGFYSQRVVHVRSR